MMWMSALPLYHFLTKRVTPFEMHSIGTKVDLERYKELGLDELKGKTSTTKRLAIHTKICAVTNNCIYFILFLCSFVVKYYDNLKPYFALDPLLCPLFIYLTPDDDFQSLCEKFNPVLTVPSLESKVKMLRGINKQEVCNFCYV